MKTTRETVAEIVGKLSAGTGDEQETPLETEIEAGAAADEPVEQPAGEEQGGEATPKGERQRGPDGKFAKADAGEGAEKPEQGKPVAPVPGASAAVPKPPDAPVLKPPADWTPKAKEEWAKVPRAAQEEAIRLHTEVKKVLQDNAGVREEARVWRETVAPFEHLFRASGRTAQQGVGWLVQQYAALSTAPIPQRAQIVAGLVRDFIGVDEASINLLASALEGKPATAPTTAAPLRPEQIQQMVREEAQRMQGEGQRQAEIKAIQDFEASAPEFLSNLTNEIAALVAIEKRQGKPITVELLKHVYERAKRINTETAAILKQRDDAASAAKRTADDKKKQAAATGIKNEPAGPAGQAAGEKSTRDTVARLVKQPRSGARV